MVYSPFELQKLFETLGINEYEIEEYHRTMVDDLLRNDRLTTIGKMAAGIAHEIRNPLTSIRGFLQLLMRDLEHVGWDKEKSYADLILAEIDRVNELLNRVLLLSKPLEIVLINDDVNTVVKDLGILHESDARVRNIQIQFQLGEIPQVKLDLNMFKQVLVNLIRNAIDAMENGGTLTLSTSYDKFENVVKIDVSDTGPGIPSYLLDRIFDAFFTTKEQGTGLGLAICQRNIHEFGGNIRVNSKGYGTTFSMLLPPIVRE